ncbi:Uridine monophosphate kinase [hydrothermal vent metagenome]|uniref:Uridylate kinase n=1 Tax=hydrothermal vent metagenome TaxID=652676 RepID=A0A3B0WMI1_9ZZZZ
MSESKAIYKRVLLKLSGEALQGPQESGIDPDTIHRVAVEIKQIIDLGIEVAIVIGAGNIFRGKGLADAGMDRVTGDHMGMLATLMNCMALQDAIEREGPSCRVMSALSIHQVCEDYVRRRAIRHLEKGRVAIFGAGTGNPFFTTDSAGALRAIEIEADVLMKATKVDGVYDSDPMKNPEAKRYESLTYDDVLMKNLAVMDATAIVLCKEQKMPLRIFNMTEAGDLVRAVTETTIGTSVIAAT